MLFGFPSCYFVSFVVNALEFLDNLGVFYALGRVRGEGIGFSSDIFLRRFFLPVAFSPFHYNCLRHMHSNSGLVKVIATFIIISIIRK